MSYHCTEETRKLVDHIAEGGNPIAAFNLKINSTTLVGEERTTVENIKLADHFVEVLTSRLQRYRETAEKEKETPGHSSMTCVPFFDIDFDTVLKFKTKKDEEVNIEAIDKNLDTFKDMFGLKGIENSIVELRNQSVLNLGRPW